jgi:hypothetical protein
MITKLIQIRKEKIMKFKNDSGRSMLEMILYLGLVVILTASTLK